jgi:hypothetical protein
LNSASSTQSAAQTQDAIRQTQEQFSLRMTADVATQNANATITQQNNNLIAAKTQTAVAANQIVTQTQSAVATLQKFADLERQRKEQDLARIAFVGMFCLPVLIGLGLLFVWRWIRIQENQQRIEMQLSTPPAEPEPVYSEPIIIEHIKYIEHEPSPRSAVSNSQNQPANPTDHVFRWLEEVKRKLLANKKDNDDKPTS